MIEAGFEEEKKVLCIKFNGWRFQGFEDAKIALIEGIVTGLVEKRPMLNKAAGALKETFKRIDWLKLAKKGGGLAWTAFTGIPSPDQLRGLVDTVKGWLGNPGQLATKANVETAVGVMEGVIKPAEAKHVPEEIAEFRKAFDELLKEADVEQFVVLIDDLDRCLPDIAIETLEAVRLFVFTGRTAFVVAADEAMIEYAVRKHFPDLPDTTGPRDYARNYLEKLIQVPFRIPALGETETRIYVMLLLIGVTIGENDEGFKKLLAAARTRLQKPWVGGALDFSDVRDAFGEKATQLQEVVVLSEQMGPPLAAGTKGNPRQIKRFLNTILLRVRIAQSRGFGDEIRIPILAKLMLAERYIPSLFEQVANSAAAASDGRCPELSVLEARVREETRPEAKKAKRPVALKESDGNGDSAVLSGWLALEAIRSWARVEPQIGETDLRPYLFVAKDRKDYFGAGSALGKLAAVVEQLFGPKVSVQGMAAALRQLVLPEASRVFDEVRSRIMSKGSFEQQPPGTDGLIVLTAAQPALESSLLDFLEALPAERLGPWAIAGWDSAIKSTQGVERLKHLLGTWATSGSATLKVAAAGALSIRSRPR
jgi:hypothetical protein